MTTNGNLKSNYMVPLKYQGGTSSQENIVQSINGKTAHAISAKQDNHRSNILANGENGAVAVAAEIGLLSAAAIKVSFNSNFLNLNINMLFYKYSLKALSKHSS